MMGNLHEHFFVISHSVMLRMKNISGKICIESKHAFYVQKYFSKIVPWENMAVQHAQP